MRKLKLLIAAALTMGAAVTADAAKTVYLNPGAWDVADATERYALYMFDNGAGTNEWVSFTEGADGIWSAEFNETYPNMILCRMDGASTENNWDSRWNQTANLDAPAADGLLYTITDINSSAYTISIYGATAASFTDGGKYLFKNVGSGRYLGPGNSWGTQASLLAQSHYNTIHAGEGVYTIESQVSNGNTDYYFTGTFMDGSAADVTISKLPNGNFLMSNGSTYYGYDASTVLANNLTNPAADNAQWQIIGYDEALADATEANPVDATFMILDQNFDRNNRNSGAWTMEASNQNLCGGKNENKCAESWRSSFTLSQTINVPNGIYRVRAQAALTEYTVTGQDFPVVYAKSDNKSTVLFNTMTNGENSMDLMSDQFTAGNYFTDWSDKVVVANGQITVGVEGTRTDTWCIWDNIQLMYYGIDLSALVESYNAKLEEANALLNETMSASYKTALQAAINANTGVDETSQTALETAIAALTEAIATANVSVNSYKLLAAGGQLPDNSLNGWTCTNSQNFVINTWSVEGNSDGTGMVTPFIQNWRNSDGVLGDGEIYYTLAGLDPGLYKFSALIRAYSESGNAPAGASLFAGSREIAFTTGKSFEYNNMKGIYDNYAMTAEVGDDGVFRFGVKIEGANFNWMAFKNCKVEYVGAAITEQSVDDLYATMPEGKMNKDVRSAAATAYAAAKATIGIETYEALDKAIVAAKASAAAYAAAVANLVKVKAEIDAELANTNVYRQDVYSTVINSYSTKYEAEELTDTEANSLAAAVSGTSVTSWHAPILIDNILLSAWDTNPDFVDAPYYINSWSVEGASDGTDFKVPFFEYYSNANAALAEKTMTATMTGLEPGTYKVSAWVRVATLENAGEADGYGITMQLNDGQAVNVCGGDVKVSGANSNQRIHGNFTAVGTVGDDGVLKIKFNVAADNNIHWLSFKNVKYTAINPVYAVVGDDSDKVIFSSGWDAATQTDILTESDGKFTKTYANQELDKQTIAFKVIMKESVEATEALAWYPGGDNLTIDIPVKGRYDITFTFDGTTVTGEATKTAEAVVIGEKGWATTVTNSPLNFAESGIKAYTATVSDDKTSVSLTEVANVQAETGLVLHGTAGTYYLPVIESSETDKGSLMFSSTKPYNTWKPTDGTVNTFYGLTVNSANKAQFVKLNDGTIPAQKAFLMVNTPASGARELKVVFAGETTGIDSIAAETAAAEGVYNLNGQRVNAPAKKGLYIVNGKKVVLK